MLALASVPSLKLPRPIRQSPSKTEESPNPRSMNDFTANRLQGIETSAIRTMTRLAIQHGAVNMAQGLPDIEPHPAILEAACKAIREGHNQYSITWGLPELREMIAQTFQRLYNYSYDPETQITVTCGVSEGIVLAILSTVNPGDEVIVIEPMHENYVPAIAFAQGKPVFVRLDPPAYRLDAEALGAAFSEKTKAIMINSPHNPTGRVFDQQELEVVAKLCQQHNAIAITDEIYDRLTFDHRPHIPLATLEGMGDRTLTIGGLGKTLAVTGWRLGYVCASATLSDAVRKLHDFTTICAPTPFQHAAVAALGLPDAFFAEQRREYEGRRDRIFNLVQSAGFVAQPPQGAYYLMSDFSRMGFEGDDWAFTKYMTEEIGIAVVPGSAFYATPGLGRKEVRWAFAKRPETLDAVAERIERLSR